MCLILSMIVAKSSLRASFCFLALLRVVDDDDEAGVEDDPVKSVSSVISLNIIKSAIGDWFNTSVACRVGCDDDDDDDDRKAFEVFRIAIAVVKSGRNFILLVNYCISKKRREWLFGNVVVLDFVKDYYDSMASKIQTIIDLYLGLRPIQSPLSTHAPINRFSFDALLMAVFLAFSS